MKVSKTLKQEISNAFAAYGEVLHGALLGAQVPSQFETLKSLPEQEIINKILILREFYNSLEEEN